MNLSEEVEIEKNKFSRSEEAVRSNQPDEAADGSPAAHNLEPRGRQVVVDAEQASQCRSS